MSVPSRALMSASLKSVFTVVLCAGVGAYGRRKGLLGEPVQRALERLLSEIFLPCLVLLHVTPCMSPDRLLDVWPLTVVCVCAVIYGLVAGALVSRCLGLVYREAFPKFRGLVMVACAFPNSFSVPLTMMLSLGDQPVFLAGGQEGGEALSKRINMLFLMSYGLWILARWSIGFPIVSGAATFDEWRRKAFNTPVLSCFVAALTGLVWNAAPAEWQPGGARIADFAVLSTPLAYAGQCAVPTVLMILGARLHEAVVDVRGTSGAVALPLLDAEAAGWTEPVVETRMPLAAHLSVVVLRQVLGPIFGAASTLGLLRCLCGVEDNLVLFVGMMQCAGPPMVNLGVMAGLSGNAKNDTSLLLLITYIVSVVSWIMAVAFFFASAQR